MHISFVMLIFLLFSDQISGGAKVSEGGRTASGGHPLWKKASKVCRKNVFQLQSLLGKVLLSKYFKSRSKKSN